MDADRKKTTWSELYKKIYIPRDWCFWNLFDFDNIKNGMVEIKKNTAGISDESGYADFLKKYPRFKMSGDADFGLKETHKYADMHKFPNFSIMPVTGGMNDKKGFATNTKDNPAFFDHFPLFIYKLAQFWECKSEERLNYTVENLWYNPHAKRSDNAENTAKCLTDYLILFNDIYEYSKRIYLIDRKLTEELCKFGESSKRDNKDDDYLIMAEKYFNARKDIFIRKGVDPQIIDCDISEDKFE